jgi:protein-disulfide isomerase
MKTGFVLCILAVLVGSGAGRAAPSGAVQDYVRQQQAQESRDKDERVAARIGALAENPGSPVIANPQGDIIIVEFFDYTCPYCKAAEPRLMRLVDGDKRVKLVMKEFPILTKASLIASRMALAAAKQGKYRAFHLALMRREGVLDEAGIMETAKAVGVDVARARRDMYAPDVTDEIIANFNLARGIRVFQTPAYIVGTHLVTGDSADVNFAREVARAKK